MARREPWCGAILTLALLLPALAVAAKPRTPPPPPLAVAAPPLPEPGAPSLAWPASAGIATRFHSGRKPNRGLDLVLLSGGLVHAAGAGKVVYAGPEPERYQTVVVIDHGSGWMTAYGWLGPLKVKQGQRVRPGQVLAPIGHMRAPGRGTAWLLHFEVRHDNQPRDPLSYLPQKL